jgi:hypothetical protein
MPVAVEQDSLFTMLRRAVELGAAAAAAAKFETSREGVSRCCCGWLIIPAAAAAVQDYVMMTKWLPETENTLPPNASHQVCWPNSLQCCAWPSR